MSEVKPDQAKPFLLDDELKAVSGGMFNAFTHFGDIKGECTDTQARSGTYSKTLTFTLSTTNP